MFSISRNLVGFAISDGNMRNVKMIPNIERFVVSVSFWLTQSTNVAANLPASSHTIWILWSYHKICVLSILNFRIPCGARRCLLFAFDEIWILKPKMLIGRKYKKKIVVHAYTKYKYKYKYNTHILYTTVILLLLYNIRFGFCLKSKSTDWNALRSFNIRLNFINQCINLTL